MSEATAAKLANYESGLVASLPGPTRTGHDRIRFNGSRGGGGFGGCIAQCERQYQHRILQGNLGAVRRGRQLVGGEHLTGRHQELDEVAFGIELHGPGRTEDFEQRVLVDRAPQVFTECDQAELQ